MQGMAVRRTRSSVAGGATGSSASQPPQLQRGRTSTFRRTGAASVGFADVAQSSPMSATSGTGGPIGLEALQQRPPSGNGARADTAASMGPMGSESGQPVRDPDEEPVGLTVASLKHLRRQRDKVTEEKTLVEKKLAEATRQVQEQRERIGTLEAEAVEFRAREAALQEELQSALQSAQAQRIRAQKAEDLVSSLEEAVAQRDAELARRDAEITQLQEALEEQRKLTRDVCEAAGRRAAGGDDSGEIAKLKAAKEALETLLKSKVQELESLKETMATTMMAAEKALAMGVHLEQLRTAKLSEAINQKVELHISVPRVTLNYNNAPPLSVSVAAALSDSRIRDFLDREVFPHFEPLWVRVDMIDQAPDGSTKKAYSTRMLDRLTEAVKRFVARSQQADAESSAAGGAVASTFSDKSAGGARVGAVASTVSDKSAGGAPAASPGRGSSLADSDRTRLLQLLKSGDDRGLDTKLQELMHKPK